MSSKQQIAEAWCTSGAQWRTVKHRYGVQGSGLVRVARMPPEECMEEVLAYLTSAAGCTGLFLDGKPLSDKFLPLSAWYERTTAANRVETVEVYHALRDKDDAEAFGPVSVRNGCTYLEEHTFYWSVAELPTVPASSSGINYALEGIRRDEESGLYSCVLVKRTRVQVNVDAYTSHDDQMSERTTAQMLGVRVTQKTDSEGNPQVDENGNPVMNTVEEQVEAFATAQGLKTEGGSGGVVVDIQKTKNDDCTTDVTIHNTEEQEVASAEVVHEINALQIVERVLNRSQSSALTHLTQQTVGAVTRHRTVKTPGNLHDTETTTTTAQPASFTATTTEDHNGVKRTITVFRNYTLDEAKALIQAAHTGSATPNEFGLYDGSCTTTTEPDTGRRAKAKRDYREYHESRTGRDIRIVNANGKTYKVTETYTYICGVLHDNDPTPTSTQSAYYMVDDCANPRVQYLGDGYWSYYGITDKTITWAAVDGSETITHNLKE